MCHTLRVKSPLAVFCLVIALFAAACSGDSSNETAEDIAGDTAGDTASDTSSDGATAAADTAASASDANSLSATPGDGTSDVSSDGTSQPASTSASGGLQIVVFGMRNGTSLALLDEPDGTEIGTLRAGANNAYFTGEAQNNAAGELLWKVEYNSLVGWVPPRFGYPAARENVTAEVATAFGETNPAQDNPVDTALVVSGLFSLTSPPSGIVVSSIVPTANGLGHVAIDVVDEGAVGQPGVLGYRVEVMTEADDAGTYQITEVWRTAMCQNGAANGECL